MTTMDSTRALLARIVPRLAEARVAVMGDPVLDCYLYGTTHRISREAPVLIVREDAREHRLGGAANTAANLTSLGAATHLVGFVGDDDDGSRLADIARDRGITTTHLLRSAKSCTVTKTRVLAGALHTTKQQMIRIDRENDGHPEPGDIERLADRAEALLEAIDALVISDYGDGALTPTYARIARAAVAKRKIVVVDSRRGLFSYAGVTAITPNEPEAEAALKSEIRTPDDAARAAAHLCGQLALRAAILTRGREGMAIAEAGKDAVLIPAHGGHEAVDVTGAGDTVAATLALGLAAGASVLEAALLANCAASVVVKSIGAATCSPEELAAAIAELRA